ncbi:MAG: primosomal protein N' (replication factor Y) [Limisphaerales bacterium]|jgi:primosomal protein N'
MVARVTLEIALKREFDYAIPREIEDRIEIGTRVRVPFGHREVFGVVTALAEQTSQTNLRYIVRAVSVKSLITPKVLALARWIAAYYCCAPETALKSVLPTAVRTKEKGFKEQLYVRLVPGEELPKLTKRQAEIYAVLEEHQELPLAGLCKLAECTAETVRRLEDKGVVAITTEINERDPYANEVIGHSNQLPLNSDQLIALKRIIAALDKLHEAPPPSLAIQPVLDGEDSEAEEPEPDLLSFAAVPEEKEDQRESHQVVLTGVAELKLSASARRHALAACRFWHGEKADCHLACVTERGIELLIEPRTLKLGGKSKPYPLKEIVDSIASYSEHEINEAMERKGAVWGPPKTTLIGEGSAFIELWNQTRLATAEEFVWFPTEPEGAVAREPKSETDDSGEVKPFVLYGVTGSGKTEVYLQAIAHSLAQGRGAIVLVPEISLTPQTVERFKARFSHGPLRTLVAVLHSHLSAGERHDEWHKIRQGRARIVIGARSAIFAPVEPLGLIVVDEEHEQSYKQEEAPRYNARDVAVVRAKRENAVVVLGSATPSMESHYNVTRDRYDLLTLPIRADDKRMPHVRVIDMRSENRNGKGPPILSPPLKEAITQRLEKSEQTILFLNRRGYSTSLQCPECGYVAECPNCSLSLTYHRRDGKLACHVCGHEERAPSVCPEPKCGNASIRYAGLGTERVEETLSKLFPHARVQRMDSDLMKRKDDYRKALNNFKAGKTDILIGTQMIAKGLHFENVTLVGVIHADLGLHIADFRAGERTFQLLTQVAGRAGRGDVEGEVFVQSFTPFHPAIQYARRHDFNGFFDQEIEFREQLKYPPLSRVAMLTLRGRNEEKVKFTAEHLRRELEKMQSGFPDMVIAGPAPAPLVRAETYYRYQIMIRLGQMSRFSREFAVVLDSFGIPDEIKLTVDIDPVNLM